MVVIIQLAMLCCIGIIPAALLIAAVMRSSQISRGDQTIGGRKQ